MRAINSDLYRQFNNPYLSARKTGDSAVAQKENPSSPRQNADELALILKLSSIDTKVRAHEAAHLAAGGGVVSGGASYSYTKGPDGKMYATAGEVPIDASEGKTPEESIRKARQITAAALAPADPSPQDYKVAASAAMMEMRAHLEKTKELQNKLQGKKAYSSSEMSAQTAIESSPSDTQSSEA